MKDVIIIGGGPAGIQAGILAKAKGLDVLIIDKNDVRGKLDHSIHLSQKKQAKLLEDLAQQMKMHGVEILQGEVVSASMVGPVKNVKTAAGEKLECRSIIIASGRSPEVAKKRDGIFQIGRDFLDPEDFNDVNVFLHGENIWMGKEVDSLLDRAKSITILSSFSLDHPKVKNLGPGEFIRLEEGEDQAKVTYRQDGKEEEITLESPYVLVAYDEQKPNSSIYIRMDLNNGYIETTDQVETNIPGVFAAGDIREKEAYNIDSSLKDGHAAALAAVKYLMK